MERLTKRTETGVAYLADPITLTCSMEDCGKVHTMIDRLADYEDTDRTPDEIEKLKKKALSLEVYKAIGTTEHLRELVAAEQEGRLVVLPFVPSLRPGYIKSALYFIEADEIVVDYLSEVIIGENESGKIVVVYYTHDGECFMQKDIGKIVFSTREEAEKALRENGKDV